MVLVVNAILDESVFGRPDEIRIELARELKKNAKERKKAHDQNKSGKKENDTLRKKLQETFGIQNPSRNDIIRYKLYEELTFNGFKDLYTNQYIAREEIFSNKYDIDHILPQSRVFDDSFSNKTLILKSINQDKGNDTALDYIKRKFGDAAVEDYKVRIEQFLKNHPEKRGKYKKLLMKGGDIGEGFIERDLRDSQFIAKKAKEMLLEISRQVVSTTGSITDRLRMDWGLMNVLQEINLEKYRKQGLTKKEVRKDGNSKEVIQDWTKRNDQRHHAMDALTIAFTKRSFIQYLNNLNAKNREDELGRDLAGIERKETTIQIDGDGNRKRIFKIPMKNFREQAKEHLENTLISYKTKNKVVTKKKVSRPGQSMQITLTPRGPLHKETIYGSIKQVEVGMEKIAGSFNEEKIMTVKKGIYRKLLLKRLQENGNDPIIAFTGKNALSKRPIFLDESGINLLPQIVETSQPLNIYTIRKEINPENFKDEKFIQEKVIDKGLQKILIRRLNDHNNNPKEAFSDLDKNPIWLNKEAGIAIKRITIKGVVNAEAIHCKKDHLGNILLKNNLPIPSDFVSTGNNHHVALYRDSDGKLHDEVVSFYKVITERVNLGLPVIDKSFNQEIGWKFLFSVKQNECFIFPTEEFDPSEVDLFDPAIKKRISPNLFRVQKISKSDYVFRHHLDTSTEIKDVLKGVTYKALRKVSDFESVIKVKLDHLGEIVKVGEY